MADKREPAHMICGATYRHKRVDGEYDYGLCVAVAPGKGSVPTACTIFTHTYGPQTFRAGEDSWLQFELVSKPTAVKK